MKAPVLLIVLILFPFASFPQGEKMKGLSLEVGYNVLFNGLNEDNHLADAAGWLFTGNSMSGLGLRVIKENQYFNIVAGCLIMADNNENFTTTSDYLLNGGGVYAGICPKIKGKHIGLTSEFAVGIFSFKEYITLNDPPLILHEKNASSGLGGLSSVGMYVKFGRISFDPAVEVIFSGGANTSFLFYGIRLPLTIHF